MKNKKFIIIGIALVLVIVSILLYFFLSSKDKEIASDSTVSSIDSYVNTDDGDEDIDWSSYEEYDYTLTKSITITDGGTYNLTGTISNGLITIDTDEEVLLNLTDVTIKNSSGPAIYVANASDVVINISGDNYLEDGSTYSGYEDDEIGVIFSHDDLTIKGDGSLTIVSNNEDGIVSKDDLKIVSGTYIIDAVDDGIRGKDSVYIVDGTFSITSGGDGIKSTNDTDSDKGFIKISNGTFTIDAELDGIQAETKLVIENGTFNITTGGGASVSSSTSSSWGNWGMNNNTSSSSTDSAKGLKAGDNIVISNGTFTLDTSDDSIHSNNYVGIENGAFNIKSGDDGIHADEEIIIDGGTIDITQSYEGIEASQITINGGSISVVSSDDGINVAGGNDSSSMGRMGENNFSSSSNNVLTINGGTIYVNASGDGLDANGSIYMTGGTVYVDGPTDSANGALDYDNAFEISGGTFIAVGSSGMAQTFTSGSTQNNIIVYFSQNYSAGSVITIEDEDGNEIMNYTTSKTFSSLVYSSASLQTNATYTIKIDGTTYKTFTISSTNSSVGSTGMGGGNNMNGNMTGGRR